MQQVNIHAAKNHLSRLIEQAAHGNPFIIAKSGKPMVTVIPYTAPHLPENRVGFLKGQIEIPDDFDSMYKEGIAKEEGFPCSLRM